MEAVQGLEKKISQLTMENSRLRQTIDLKDGELSWSQVLLDDAHKDVVHMAEICNVPATTIVQVGLFNSGITNSAVFKGDTFKKFVVSTMNFTKRIEESNKEVLAVLKRVDVRIMEAGPSLTPVKPFRKRYPNPDPL